MGWSRCWLGARDGSGAWSSVEPVGANTLGLGDDQGDLLHASLYNTVTPGLRGLELTVFLQNMWRLASHAAPATPSFSGAYLVENCWVHKRIQRAQQDHHDGLGVAA